MVRPDISEVEVGDSVWALDPETAVEGERTVTGVWPHYDWLLNFSVGDGFNVQEYVLNTNPATGQTFVNKGPVRAALPEEIPS